VAKLDRNTMGAQIRQPLVDEPLLHLARRQDVLIWSLEEVDG
jgi:hypothetical protein